VRSRPVARVLAAVAAVLAVLASLASPALAAAPEWNVDRVGGPVSAAGVLIAVIDTGVDARHPALAGRVEPAIDLVGGGGGDPNGHGTHVAGTIAGADSNPGCGSIGVTPDARILPVRVLDRDGEGTVATVAEGIRRAADRGAVVINLSLGSDVVLRNVSGSGLREAIEYAWSKGSIPVLAAGNDGLIGGLAGSGYGRLPAVVVTATDHRDRVAPYATSIGSAQWGIAAPGGDTSGQTGRDILSAFPDQRCALNAGTSMAAPHVSAGLAAVRARGLAPAAAVDRVLATARDLGRPGPDSTYGHGLLDLRAALAGLSASSAPPAPEPPAPPAPPATEAPAPAPPPTTAAPSAPATSATPATAPASTAPSEGATDAEADAEGEPAAPEIAREPAPRAPVDDGGQASGATVTDDDDDGVPGVLVAVAILALGVVGTASGVAARRLGRP
jgi:serine protease